MIWEEQVMNILIVEDDKMLLKALSHELTDAEHNVYCAENGNEAMDILSDNKVDLVISDLMMPVLDGATFITLLRNYFNSGIPVIVMSSLNQAESILKKHNIEFSMFLQKPFVIDEMLKVVEQFKIA